MLTTRALHVLTQVRVLHRLLVRYFRSACSAVQCVGHHHGTGLQVDCFMSKLKAGDHMDRTYTEDCIFEGLEMWDTHLAGNRPRHAAQRPRVGLPHLESLRALTAHLPLRPLDVSQGPVHCSPAAETLSARSSAKPDAVPLTAREHADKQLAPRGGVQPSPTPTLAQPQSSLSVPVSKVTSGGSTPRISPSSSVLPVSSGLPPLPHGSSSLAKPGSPYAQPASSLLSLQSQKSALQEAAPAAAPQSSVQIDSSLRPGTNPLPASLSLPRGTASRVLSVASGQGSDFAREQALSAVRLCKFRVIPGAGMDGTQLFWS
jgi:hypothetical protein